MAKVLEAIKKLTADINGNWDFISAELSADIATTKIKLSTIDERQVDSEERLKSVEDKLPDSYHPQLLIDFTVFNRIDLDHFCTFSDSSPLNCKIENYTGFNELGATD
ncbi:hypothetical protein R5R35_008244 [Gryllus longicercus]|uniref:Uncharacterized protein n=1 Tax=Gryllus longicercus TaxID=2509291 RepID=A0AAN9V1T0_9ORTH